MKKIIVALHGLGNKPEPDVLKDGWLKAILEGLDRIGKPHPDIPFEMVYWADLSYEAPLNAAEKDPEDLLFLSEPYAPGSTLSAPKPQRAYLAVLKFIEKHLDRFFLRTNMEEIFPAASAKMMERYFTELDTYYTDECRSLDNKDCSMKNATQERLIRILEKYSGYDILLLTHSMGSIIAFDALSNPANAFEIHTFVTMGSPLGLPPIVARNFQSQKTETPALRKPRAPASIWPHWYNLSDLRDTVALDHTLRDDYAPNARGVRALDLQVTNDYQIHNEPNPHKSYGYLRARETAEIIDTFLSSKRDHSFKGVCRFISGNLLSIPRRLKKWAH
ncbi:hypothetical protein P4E94_03555 [Pontiellaceae bacterium B12219]|nr:hypothetical protein [Pontiellaceae bacterium B12219]